MKKKCLFCSNEFVPRRYNQIFCSIRCRSTYHNNKARAVRHKTKDYANGLYKNRKILASLFKEEESDNTFSEDFLKGAGYKFNLLTHTLTDKKDVVYNFCFDFALAVLNNNQYKIVSYVFKP